MYKKHTYVLGTHLSHDGSACLLKDGKIVVAIEKERITRIKHHGNNDKLAIEYCLEAEGITLADIDLVVQNANFEKESIDTTNYGGSRAFTSDFKAPIITISHHLAHAYSAIGTSPFDNCNVMVIDGSGSPFTQCDDLTGASIPNLLSIEENPHHFWCEKFSVYDYRNNKLTPIYKDFSEFNHMQAPEQLHMPTIIHSIGGCYQAASLYCFGSIDDTGKLMGLSPYGEKDFFKQPIFDLKDGRVFNTLDWLSELKHPSHSYENFKTNFQHYANIARWLQDETERALLYLFNHHQSKHSNPNWCYAGGVALNAVANHRILAETSIENLYIQPAAGDNGIAIGCAYYGWLEILKKERVKHTGASNFGKKYTVNHISIPENLSVQKTTDWINITAKLLSEGNIIAWFNDGCEFGPRALGYRSILADPRKKGVKDYINKYIKLREDFRPFAPAVMREHCTDYFEYDWDSPYMILVNPVKPEWKNPLENIVHLNGTARVQTVSEENNINFYNLLHNFKTITGLPILLNTSLNRRGMPIIETPQQAMDFFIESPLDYLIFENIIIGKSNENKNHPGI